MTSDGVEEEEGPTLLSEAPADASKVEEGETALALEVVAETEPDFGSTKVEWAIVSVVKSVRAKDATGFTTEIGF